MLNFTKPLPPPLKWAGGKRWLVPKLLPIWNEYREHRLVELFAGGLSIALGFQPKQALVNDINPHLMNFYHWLLQGLTAEFTQADNDKDVFYINRDRFNSLIHAGKSNTMESARLFYYLNRTGFNGLCRFNKSGFFNVPFGTYKNINYMNTADFMPYKAVLEKWELSNKSFVDIDIEPDDFVYADPPYDVPFTQYSKENFTWDEQIQLAAKLAKHSGVVILSNQATSRIIELYQDYGFTLLFVDAPRRINSTGDRTPAKEVIATLNVGIDTKKIYQIPIWERLD